MQQKWQQFDASKLPHAGHKQAVVGLLMCILRNDFEGGTWDLLDFELKKKLGYAASTQNYKPFS